MVNSFTDTPLDILPVCGHDERESVPQSMRNDDRKKHKSRGHEDRRKEKAN